MTRPAIKYEGQEMARSEGLVEALTGEREDVEAATSAGNGTALLKRRLVRVKADLAAAKARVATELHAVPGVAALMHKVEQLQSDFAEAQSTIERLRGSARCITAGLAESRRAPSRHPCIWPSHCRCWPPAFCSCTRIRSKLRVFCTGRSVVVGQPLGFAPSGR